MTQQSFAQNQPASVLGKWTTEQIKVCWIDTPDNYKKERKWVEDGIKNSWEAFSDIKFIGWEKCEPYAAGVSKGVRIFVGDQPSETSGIGQEIDGKEIGITLNFSFKNSPLQRTIEVNRQIQLEAFTPKKEDERKLYIKSIAVHEFGHILGFCHEQLRNDCSYKGCAFSDTLAKSNPNCLWSSIGCDERSVMNYCNDYFFNEGYLTDLDVKNLIRVYPTKKVFIPEYSIMYKIKPDVVWHLPKLFSRKVENDKNSNPNSRDQQQKQDDRGSSAKSKLFVFRTKYKKADIWINGDVSKINYVEYSFHRNTFRKAKSTNSSQRFAYRLTRLRGNFMCRAKVVYNDVAREANVATQYITIGEGQSDKSSLVRPR